MTKQSVPRLRWVAGVAVGATLCSVTLSAPAWASATSTTKSATATAGQVVRLSAAQTTDNSQRIAAIANSVDNAYLVPAAQSKGPGVIRVGQTPAQGAAALATSVNLGPKAQKAVTDSGTETQAVRDGMVAAKDPVADSSAVVDSMSAVTATDGLQTLTAQVHFTRHLKAGPVWEEVIPYVVTVDPATGKYLNISIQDDLGTDDTPAPGTAPTPPTPTATASAPSSSSTSTAQTLATAVPLSIGSGGKEKAAAYADRYWSSYNIPPWVKYSNDCANFVSQSMLAGGWLMNKDLSTYRNGYPVRWFWVRNDAHSNGYSTSWTVSQDFYNMALVAAGWMYDSHDRYALRRGDILQWRTPNYDHISHSTIVTGFTTEPLLTYHTTDTHNLPLSAVIARLNAQGYPGTQWYPSIVT